MLSVRTTPLLEGRVAPQPQWGADRTGACDGELLAPKMRAVCRVLREVGVVDYSASCNDRASPEIGVGRERASKKHIPVRIDDSASTQREPRGKESVTPLVAAVAVILDEKRGWVRRCW